MAHLSQAGLGIFFQFSEGRRIWLLGPSDLVVDAVAESGLIHNRSVQMPEPGED